MSTVDRYLMCKPVYFNVSYVINPWMAGNLYGVSAERSRLQWERLCDAVAALAQVELIAPEPGLPDMIFTANAGLPVGGKVLLSRFRHPERQSEERLFESWFDSQGFEVRRLPSDVAFEGAGDAAIDRDHVVLWAAQGFRSDRESHPYLSRLLDLEVLSVHLIDPRFYHLDTCFCPLENGYLLYYEGAFDEQSRHLIQSRYAKEKLIALTEEDAERFACNAVNIGESIILNGASENLIRQLASANFQVISVDLSEFIKSGGAAKCLTLRLSEPHPNSRL
jgi:N-dimethylarginine dimethylaminohydrolase